MNISDTDPFIANLRSKLENSETSVNFPVELMCKDLNLLMETASEYSVPVPMSSLAKSLNQFANNAGYSRDDLSSIYHHLTK